MGMTKQRIVRSIALDIRYTGSNSGKKYAHIPTAITINDLTMKLFVYEISYYPLSIISVTTVIFIMLEHNLSTKIHATKPLAQSLSW